MSKGDNMFIVGKVLNTHSWRGEVKVQQITDFAERFNSGETVYAKDEEGQIIPLKIKRCRKHKNALLIHFDGYDSLNEVEFLKGLELMIKEEQLTPLAPGEYYYHEIIGCKVVTTDKKEIGVIESILTPGANDVWVVRGENNKEILLPYIKQVVKEVDVVEKQVMIEVMEGLID